MVLKRLQFLIRVKFFTYTKYSNLDSVMDWTSQSYSFKPAAFRGLYKVLAKTIYFGISQSAEVTGD